MLKRVSSLGAPPARRSVINEEVLSQTPGPTEHSLFESPAAAGPVFLNPSKALRPSSVGPDGRYRYDEKVRHRSESVVERSREITHDLSEALTLAQALLKELQRGLEVGPPAMADPQRWFVDVRDDVLATLEEVSALGNEYGSFRRELEGSMESLISQEKGLLESLERIRTTAALDPLTAADPQERANRVMAKYGEIRNQLALEQEAMSQLNGLVVPGTLLDQTYGAISGSVVGGEEGLWSVYADVGLRRTERTFERASELFPVATVGVDTGFGGAGFTVTSEPASSGFSASFSAIPFVSVGMTPRGRTASVDIPGLVGLGIHERGEVGAYVAVPVTPVFSLGLDLRLGNPRIKGLTSAVLGRVDHVSLALVGWVEGVRHWLETHVNAE
jgi:hypothetical protein